MSTTPRHIWRGQAGSAAVEFTFLVIGMLLPFTWVVATLVTIHSAALAVDDAAKQAARAFSLSASPSQAQATANWTVGEIVRSHGLANTEVTAKFVCTPFCLQPGGGVRAEVSAKVGLPWVPISIGLPGAISIEAVHVERIDLYRDTP